MTEAPVRILLAGVPFGCDNIGDEAILDGVVSLLRTRLPTATITASTRSADPRTADAVVRCSDDLDPDCGTALEILRSHDWVVWAGATGLSDYPEIGCAVLVRPGGRVSDRGLRSG